MPPCCTPSALIDAGMWPSPWGSRGDSYDALAESVIGLCRTEVTGRPRWDSLEAVEFATPRCVVWFGHRRIFGPIGFVPPAEYEAAT